MIPAVAKHGHHRCADQPRLRCAVEAAGGRANNCFFVTNYSTKRGQTDNKVQTVTTYLASYLASNGAQA
jgi:hypothetical protein